MAGGGGRGLVAMGTHPMAAARANGSHAATEAMFGAISTTNPEPTADDRSAALSYVQAKKCLTWCCSFLSEFLSHQILNRVFI